MRLHRQQRDENAAKPVVSRSDLLTARAFSISFKLLCVFPLVGQSVSRLIDQLNGQVVSSTNNSKIVSWKSRNRNPTPFDGSQQCGNVWPGRSVVWAMIESDFFHILSVTFKARSGQVFNAQNSLGFKVSV